jgi:hypothetical protein
MVSSPRHRRIQKLANMLGNKSMSLKLGKNIVFTIYYSSYFKAQHIVNVPCLCLRVASAGGAKSIILSAPFDHVITLTAVQGSYQNNNNRQY